ncbi:Uncharacterised protein [Pseudomonas aeruginosa]|nr:Uncharacterised protein [Pseudomonas aeruginosa]
MSKRRDRHQRVATTEQAREGELLVKDEGGKSMAFTFGDPVPVLDGREILDYLECWANGRWYEPPVSLDGLARSTKASVYLQSGLNFKRNALARTFIPHRMLSRAAFEQIVMDWGGAATCTWRSATTCCARPLACSHAWRSTCGGVPIW